MKPTTYVNAITTLQHGPIRRMVVADRDLYDPWGAGIYAGQLCFLEESGLFEGYHAFRFRDTGLVTVARVQVHGGGFLRLSWLGSKEDGIDVERGAVEHLGAVVGCYSNQSDPVLWAFAN